jgi:hypothetical protein
MVHLGRRCRPRRPDHEATAAGAALGLAGEEGGGDGGAQAVVLGEVAGAEVVAEERRHFHGAARHLPEEHEHHAVDPRRRPRALVADHLATCVHACNWNEPLQ